MSKDTVHILVNFSFIIEKWDVKIVYYTIFFISDDQKRMKVHSNG